MYTRPIIYKVYSILVIVFAALGFIGSIISGFSFTSMLSKYFPFLNGFSVAVMILVVIVSLISVFFSYIEFSSMFTFAEMIEYENSNSMYPFEKKSFVLPAKFYKGYGSVIFYITLFLEAIIIIATIISASIEKQAFICLPVIPIAISLLSLVLTYIVYYAKYKAFADLLQIVSQKEVDQATKESLKENKPNLLRGYCTFLFVIAILSAIAIIALVIFMFNPLLSVLGAGVAIAISVVYIVLGILLFLSLSVTGCYFDNLAKMLEHHMIRFKMI